MSPLLGTVLVVDDIEGIRRLIGGALIGLVETVHEAATGSDALALAREHVPELILLDLALPDMTGVEILRALQADPKTADVPVVIVTALGTSDLARQARDAGAAALMEKPFRPAQLRTLVSDLAEASKGSAA